MGSPLSYRNIAEGVFEKAHDGYFTFMMEDGERITFEKVHSKVMLDFDLSTNAFVGKRFEISYTEEVDDEDEDFIIYQINNLKLVSI